MNTGQERLLTRALRPILFGLIDCLGMQADTTLKVQIAVCRKAMLPARPEALHLVCNPAARGQSRLRHECDLRRSVCSVLVAL
jgi:hypothetical protein